MWSRESHHLAGSASALTMGRILTNQAVIRGDATAIEHPHGSMTYAELDGRSNQLAHQLADQGVTPGTTVAAVSENSVELCVLLYAAAKISAAVSLINWRHTPEEIAYCIDLVQPLLVTASTEHERLAREALSSLGRTMDFCPLGLIHDDDVGSVLGAAWLQPTTAPEINVASEQILTIMYTSGTTGKPKAAAISHRALAARAILVAAEFKLDEKDSFIAWAPMFHIISTDYMFVTHLCGGKLIVLPGFDPDAIVEKLFVERIGWLALMPGVIEPVIQRLEASARPVAGVRVVGTMADLVPTDQLVRLTRLLNAPYFNAFGSTEAGSVPSAGTLLPIGQAPITLAKRQTGFCDVRLETEDGSEAAIGTVGELLLRGPTLFSGYWNDDGATRAAFRGGWFRSGDLFSRTESGMLDFVGRLKYMIKSGGENIYPAEIEHILLRHPAVEEAVVVRRPDRQWGEVPVAVIAVNSEISAKDVSAYCASRLARHKRPKGVVIKKLHEFPRNVTGKILRHVLEQELNEATVPNG